MNFLANTVASQKRQYRAVERKVKQQSSTGILALPIPSRETSDKSPEL